MPSSSNDMVEICQTDVMMDSSYSFSDIDEICQTGVLENENSAIHVLLDDQNQVLFFPLPEDGQDILNADTHTQITAVDTDGKHIVFVMALDLEEKFTEFLMELIEAVVY